MISSRNGSQTFGPDMNPWIITSPSRLSPTVPIPSPKGGTFTVVPPLVSSLMDSKGVAQSPLENQDQGRIIDAGTL
ncbi:hypothetical protein GCM10009864_35090 [Streptomyces lunalinharesii]|uniref:Uncharacterized protein n=1 Tax=Streptomyces lunalinharesii TaxID=333384 RepID=A0ABN3RYB3_9ACTN